MKVLSFIPDHRIESANVLIELTIDDYMVIAKDILENNDYQRKRVIKGKIQELLRSDLLRGCTIPPIVLAVKKTALDQKFNYEKFDDEKYVIKMFTASDLLILDGLQRTYVMLDIIEDYKNDKITKTDFTRFSSQKIRAELYVGLKKLGILYRMLTLNTGQTTMSSRHLMEILYMDYKNTDVEGIRLVTDKESRPLKNDTTEFSFKEILDGYYSFIEGTEVPIDRADILENIQSIKELEKTDEEKEGFRNFLITYKNLIDKIISLSDNFIFNEQVTNKEYILSGPPFGVTALDIFRKSQALTGFGAALSFLRSKRSRDFSNVLSDIPNIYFEATSAEDQFYLINKHFDYIRNRSKKVGNDQRYYFKTFFQSLFDSESEHHLKFDSSFGQAYKRLKERIEDEE